MCFSWWDLTPPLERHTARRLAKFLMKLWEKGTISHSLQITLWTQKMSPNYMWIWKDGRMFEGRSTVCSVTTFTQSEIPLFHTDCIFLECSLSYFDLCIISKCDVKILLCGRNEKEMSTFARCYHKQVSLNGSVSISDYSVALWVIETSQIIASLQLFKILMARLILD